MKLTLDEIWKMADLLEEAQKISVGNEELVQEKETQERVLKLPKLQISENWGKQDKVERAELERIVNAATGKANTAYDKFVLIQQQMDQLKKGQLGTIRSPRTILSKIILLETLNRLFKSFQPAPAGFINEAFLSVFYKSYQVAAGEANKDKDIGDITDEGYPVSIKTKTSGALIVDGSVENLIESIKRKGKVYFDIYEKKFSGSKEDRHVGSLTFTRFTIDATNVNAFLGRKVITQDAEGNIVFTSQFKKPPKKQLPQTKDTINEGEGDELDPITGDDLPEPLRTEFDKQFYKLNRKGEKIPAQTSSTRKATIIFDFLKKNKFTIPRAGSLTKEVNNLEATGMRELVGMLSGSMRKSSSPVTKEKIRTLIQIVSGIRLDKTTIEEPSQQGIDREFSLPESHWRIFAQQQGAKEITLNFSDNDIQKLLENAVANLNKVVIDLFNNLDAFSTSIQAYLTSMEANRGQDGLTALKYARKLEPSTEKVVQTLKKEPEEETGV